MNPLPPLPPPQITPGASLTVPWQAWFNQLYTYVTAPAAAGGGLVPAARKISTTAPLSGGGTLSTDRTLSILTNGITNALLAQMPATTLKGNNAATQGNALDLTPAQVTAILNTFTAALQGLVPASGGGTANYLRADGTFSTPPGTASSANPSASVGLTPVNGTAATFMTSDSAPQLSQAITPTWSNPHTFAQNAPGAATGTVFRNTATSAGSDSRVTISVPSGAVANPALVFDTQGVADWYVGSSTSAGSIFTIGFGATPGAADKIQITGAGAVKITSTLGINNATPPAQVTGFGTPTGTGVIANFPGATATLAQVGQAVAELIKDLKAFGLYGA